MLRHANKLPSIVFHSGNCDVLFEMQEHEQALVDAIERLEDASDGESGNN
jgi:hypothetical protein